MIIHCVIILYINDLWIRFCPKTPFFFSFWNSPVPIPDHDLSDLYDYFDRFECKWKLRFCLILFLLLIPILFLIPNHDLSDLHDYIDRFKSKWKLRFCLLSPVLILILLLILFCSHSLSHSHSDKAPFSCPKYLWITYDLCRRRAGDEAKGLKIKD